MKRLALLENEFLWFGLKQGWACIFGALLLLALMVTRFWYPEGLGLARYDFLFVYAVVIQMGLLAFRLESIREFGVVLIFHILATGMELFKTSGAIGSWSYPGESIIRLGNVPLFAGFMYSAVGSYLSRVWRVFRFRFTGFPPLWAAGLLAGLAYLNFFTHHYLPDIRWLLVAGMVLAFWRSRVYFTPHKREFSMNLLLGFLLVTFFIWIAENLGTVARAWVYPNQQDGWQLVGFGKFTSWLLLMQLSFVLVYALRTLEARLKGALPPSR